MGEMVTCSARWGVRALLACACGGTLMFENPRLTFLLKEDPRLAPHQTPYRVLSCLPAMALHVPVLSVVSARASGVATMMREAGASSLISDDNRKSILRICEI